MTAHWLAGGSFVAATERRGVDDIELGTSCYVITEACIDVKSRACVEVCPVDCIKGGDDDPQLYIDPDVCLICGACEAACPVDAIYYVGALPERLKPFIAINAAHFAPKS